jgi:ATP-dependent DNA ligase
MPLFEGLLLRPPVDAMETRQVASIPVGAEWTYEPKWDGFRCIAFRDGSAVELQSKSGQSLTRYFPEVVSALVIAKTHRFVVDGELFIESGAGLDFDALLQRIHPADSRVRMLAQQTPATYALFDLLVRGQDAVYADPYAVRRGHLESFVTENFGTARIVLSPSTADQSVAAAWLAGSAVRIDGIIAKRDVPYAFGGREAAVKVKRRYTADCVVGGFRLAKDGSIASLLLGLYDDAALQHVGFVGSMSATQRERAAALLKPIVAPPGFTGAAPGGPSRWRRAEDKPWFPVRPEIVVEVAFDHVTARRFRHAARFLRWRPDKAPRQCTMAQLERARGAPPRAPSG